MLERESGEEEGKTGIRGLMTTLRGNASQVAKCVGGEKRSERCTGSERFGESWRNGRLFNSHWATLEKLVPRGCLGTDNFLEERTMTDKIADSFSFFFC